MRCPPPCPLLPGPWVLGPRFGEGVLGPTCPPPSSPHHPHHHHHHHRAKINGPCLCEGVAAGPRRLHTNTADALRVQGVSGWFRGVQGGSGAFRGVQGGSGGFRGVQGVQGGSGGFRGVQGVKGGFSRVQQGSGFRRAPPESWVPQTQGPWAMGLGEAGGPGPADAL